jgi:hypothetical protein
MQKENYVLAQFSAQDNASTREEIAFFETVEKFQVTSLNFQHEPLVRQSL